MTMLDLDKNKYLCLKTYLKKIGNKFKLKDTILTILHLMEILDAWLMVQG